MAAVRAVLEVVTVTEVAAATGPRVGCLQAGEAYEGDPHSTLGIFRRRD
jgi:hypothetical protein